jgi:hypothetical protein
MGEPSENSSMDQFSVMRGELYGLAMAAGPRERPGQTPTLPRDGYV